MGRRVIYSSSSSSSGGDTRHYSVSTLRTALIALPVGSSLPLYGPGDEVICHYWHVSSGVIRALGLIDCTHIGTDLAAVLDVDADGSGNGFDPQGSANAPTVSSSGIALDGSGLVVFGAFGIYTAEALAVAARMTPTTAANLSGMAFGVGTTVFSRGYAFGGGFSWDGLDWRRQQAQSNTYPGMTYSGTGADDGLAASGSPGVAACFRMPTTVAGNKAAFLAGGYGSDADTGQQAQTNAVYAAGGDTDHELYLHSHDGGGTLSVLVEKMYIGHLSI